MLAWIVWNKQQKKLDINRNSSVIAVMDPGTFC